MNPENGRYFVPVKHLWIAKQGDRHLGFLQKLMRNRIRKLDVELVVQINYFGVKCRGDKGVGIFCSS